MTVLTTTGRCCGHHSLPQIADVGELLVPQIEHVQLGMAGIVPAPTPAPAPEPTPTGLLLGAGGIGIPSASGRAIERQNRGWA